MPEATLHDESPLEIEINGAGPTLLLPVNPRPVEGPRAQEFDDHAAQSQITCPRGRRPDRALTVAPEERP